ncbi:MAG: tRNA pseudouridine(38-40) synthase TruA [Oscillospiraceae bacterium]|nr:tRNA pseudouridine(38-40) synthase TruA [Oscillospiraceae bacterium]
MYTYRLTLCYDGSRYNGWQKQGNTKNTIQEKLETLLTRLLDEEIEVAGSGRTDAGVHAMGQVVSFHSAQHHDPAWLLGEMRRYLPDDIGAMELTVASPRFHARLNATGKTYVYRIWNSDAPNVFERKYMYTMPDTLDISAMEAAAAHLIGTHNFMSFCANKRMKKSTVRTITDLRIDRLGHEVRFTVTGDGFLYNMVRILVGTLLEVGTGKRAADSIPALLDAADRSQAGYLVPPHGLRLEAVYYD